MEIERLEEQLRRKQAELSTLIRNCPHRWSAVVPDHIYEKGYEIPADPPGTMGVDWRPAYYVQPKTTKRWKRVCMECGKVEHTSSVEKQVTEIPKF